MLISKKLSQKQKMETIQTRSEHSRSLEDAEQLKAMQVLVDVGLLTPLDSIETFHGRASYEDETPWAVDPTFENGSNDTGNNNFNNRPALHTAESDIAIKFAKTRLAQGRREKYFGHFEDIIRNYTAEEKQEWLDRENKRRSQEWESKDSSLKEHYITSRKGIPAYWKQLTLENLEGEIRKEAERLHEATPENQQKAIWSEVVKNSGIQTHKIVSADPDAMIINLGFHAADLEPADEERLEAALQKLALPITEGSPVEFYDQPYVVPFVEVAKSYKPGFLSVDDIKQISQKAGVPEQMARQLGGAFNARQMMIFKPAYMAHKILVQKHDIITDDQIVRGEVSEVVLNLDYVKKFLQQLHVVGAQLSVSSATLGQNIDVVSMFDLKNVDTARSIQVKKEAAAQKLGSISVLINRESGLKTAQSQEVMKLLEGDAYAKPEKLVEAAKQIEGYKEIFESDAGNHEGFTLEEHTETVLRNFDENYADSLPVELLAPLRLALLAHDLGKPAAVANREKRKQMQYNQRQASEFFGALGVSQKTASFLLSIIGKGAELAHKIEISGVGEIAEKELAALAKNSLRAFVDDDEAITQKHIEGYINICKILLTCDGGAYTSMAVTRKKGQFLHRNAPSFNGTFVKPVGLGKRDLKIAKGNEPRAPRDLMPIDPEAD